MKACLVNYNYDPTWLKDYDLDVVLFDRSDDGIERNLQQYGEVYKTRNIGDVDYDKLGWLVNRYDSLPDVFLWGKTNLFKYVAPETFQKALEASTFQPLLKYDHNTYSDRFGPVCFYREDLYWERADSWFFHAQGVEYRHVRSWEEWCKTFGIKAQGYIPFAPGGNYILTRERVHTYSRDYYDEMRSMMPHSVRPAEAQCAERSYTLLWK